MRQHYKHPGGQIQNKQIPVPVAPLPPLPRCASAGGFHTHPCAPCGRTGISQEPAGHRLQTHPLKNTMATVHTHPASNSK